MPEPDPSRPAGQCADLLRLMDAGKLREAAARARLLTRFSADPHERTQAHLFLMGALLTLGQTGTPEFARVLAEADDAVKQFPEPAFVGEFHALAGGAAFAVGEIENAMLHTIDGMRATAQAGPSVTTALAWYDLAWTAGELGMTDEVDVALRHAHETGSHWGLRYEDAPMRLVTAVSADHRGDTDQCALMLAEMSADGRRLAAGDLDGVAMADRAYLAYATARYTVLGGDPGVDPRRLMPAEADQASNPYRTLTRVCLAITAGRPTDVLPALDATVPINLVHEVEILRLRSLALSSAGDLTGALAAERQAMRRFSEPWQNLRRLATHAARFRADHAVLSEYAAAALTDPLTGLPNRRHLEERLEELSGRRERAIVGLMDLDNFKDVNTHHGHLAGDAVLARIASVVASSLREGDFLARYGGDEFVAVLTETSLRAAHEVGDRVSAALARVNWSELALGAPVGISIGWAELTEHGPGAALAAADQAMYARKGARDH
ncbi:GGDEF domain-containing protein [Actinokineospora xionganensis]|uniref:GGDEF domain-containing protein n=1 Tax=Actinokineospora xionganensis TaxID=2684470 RepID=A0ABR7LDU4_9PSEU|nr:GGDEF domain-containing protein [Actinokineospora xionganensis]MBC6450768.1 GGDEF domain-containing protein [Actinokineospora xionganensis]